MRVATIITRLNIGGVSPPVISLAVGLRSRGHDHLLVIGTPEAAEGTLEVEAERAGVAMVRIPDLRRNPDPPRDLRVLGRLHALLRDYRPDVVATHMSKAGALGRLAARRAGVPVVVHTYHGKGFDVFPRGWRRTAALSIERLLARMATGNIVVSEKQHEEFTRLRVAPPAKLRTIHYGIDLEPFLQAQRQGSGLRRELGVGDEAVLVGVVARLVRIKGQDVFLRAAARLRASHPNAQFVLVGDGSERAAYEALARELGVEARFLGWRRDIPNVVSGLDVVVLSTAYEFEGTPVALIEALAGGRAVVATDVGGVAEVIKHGETGFVVPPRDPEALAAAIAPLLANPTLRATVGCCGQRLVCEQYGVERMVAETEAYFRELLDRGAC